MCLIIDNSVAGVFISDRNHANHRPIYRWIKTPRGRIAFGGRLWSRESKKNEGMRLLLLELARQGRALRIPDEEIDIEESRIKREALHISNDPHVLALARVSGSRRLFSDDGDLATDFKNRAILDPPGKVYRNHTHKRVLSDAPPCKPPHPPKPKPARVR